MDKLKVWRDQLQKWMDLPGGPPAAAIYEDVLHTFFDVMGRPIKTQEKNPSQPSSFAAPQPTPTPHSPKPTEVETAPPTPLEKSTPITVAEGDLEASPKDAPKEETVKNE